jgi:hypothetical protein
MIIVDFFQEPELLLTGRFPGYESLTCCFCDVTGIIFAARTATSQPFNKER